VLDPAVPDRSTLIAGLRPGVELLELSSSCDGIAGIASTLAATRALGPIATLHVISHGAPGALVLGGTRLTEANLPVHADALLTLRDILAPDSQLLLYGCEVAKGPEGRAFVQALSELMSADVAANEFPTGSADLGGTWQLVSIQDERARPVAVEDPAQSAYAHVLTVPSGVTDFTGIIQVVDGLASSTGATASATDVFGWDITVTRQAGSTEALQIGGTDDGDNGTLGPDNNGNEFSPGDATNSGDDQLFISNPIFGQQAVIETVTFEANEGSFDLDDFRFQVNNTANTGPTSVTVQALSGGTTVGSAVTETVADDSS
jgi:hypothetical protein